MIVGVFFLMQFFILIVLAKLNSQTTDEGVHIGAGYTYLTRHDYRFNPEHPPLIKKLAAFPLLFMKLNTPSDDTYWNGSEKYYVDNWQLHRGYGEDFLYRVGNNADKILFWARLPMICLTLILGLAIFFISARLWGWGGGLLSTIVYIFEPVILGHGNLITTDIGVALGFLISIWLFWKMLNRQKWLDIIWFGLAFGVTMLMKYTAILLAPVLLAIIIYYLYIEKKWKRWYIPLGKLILGGILCWVVIWAGYDFNTQLAPKITKVDNRNYITTDKNNVTDIVTTKDGSKFFNFMAANPKARYFLIPRDYFKGLSMVLIHANYGHWAYLMGKFSNFGWWYYFPIIFLVKSAITTVILSFLGLYFLFKKTKKREAIVLVIAGAVFFVLAMIAKANIGVRHIMPIYPILFIIIGGLVVIKVKWKKIIALGLVGVLIIELVLSWPNYIAFFNLLSGGQKNGWRIATDSNLDWGQDLYRIKKYINEHNLKDVYIEYYWDSEKALEYYGIKSLPIDGLNEHSLGYVIIGASARNSDRYKWLKNKTIEGRIGGTIFVYRLNREIE